MEFPICFDMVKSGWSIYKKESDCIAGGHLDPNSFSVNTVNSEIFVCFLFSLIALKDMGR